MVRVLQKTIRLVATTTIPILVVCACGGSSGSTGGSNSNGGRFPASDYPPSIFKGLTGTIGYYDTGGGQAWDAMNASLVKDFTDLTGVTVTEDYNKDSTKFFAAEQTGQPVPWSMTLVETLGDAAYAEDNGWLTPIDKKIVPLDRLLKGTYDNYGIAFSPFAMVLTWNTTKWPLSKPHPETMADLYDTTKFPGKRCFYNYPEVGWTLESALLASGVTPKNLYPLDVPRALAKLSTIKNDIVWWGSGGQSVQDFENGSCVIGEMWSGRAYIAATQDHFPLASTWNQAGYVSELLSIPKGAPNPKATQAFLRMAILDKPAAIKYAGGIAYPLVTGATNTTLNDYPASLRPFLPLGDNLKVAIPEDDVYYHKELTNVVKQFDNWLASS